MTCFACILQGTSDPVKVFDRAANLEQTQIISYRVDPSEKWCVACCASACACVTATDNQTFMQVWPP